MTEATVTVDHSTAGFTEAYSVAHIRVEVPGLGSTGYKIKSENLTDELLEELRVKGAEEIREVIEKHSVTRGNGRKEEEAKDEPGIETVEEKTAA